ncbi:MAG: shikimate dehydrogenase, partial [Spirochaetales bacterium]|nr:shikimate dehydrogenase [Spirochaetales bacterium]
GDLIFLDQANAQKDAKSLRIEDGWFYFIHGWTRVIAEVFHIDIPTSGPEFEKLSELAASTR